jgi:hypothetical protein
MHENERGQWKTVTNSNNDSSLGGGKGATIGFTELVIPSGKQVVDRTKPAESQLLPHLSVLIYKLMADCQKDDKKYTAKQWDLQQLPYSLRATYDAYLRFAEGCRKLAASLDSNSNRLILTPAHTYEISFAIDSFLEAGRRTQNALISYLGKALKLSFPSSFHEFQKKLRADKYEEFPQVMREFLLNYWDSHGKKLKDYRDIAQHHALVASEVTLFRNDEGVVGIVLLLPSNPESDSAAKIVWGQPKVHAQKFLREQLKYLIWVAHVVTKMLVDAIPGEAMQLLGNYPRNEQKIGRDIVVDGYIPLTVEAIEKSTFELLEKFHAMEIPPIELK